MNKNINEENVNEENVNEENANKSGYFKLVLKLALIAIVSFFAIAGFDALISNNSHDDFNYSPSGFTFELNESILDITKAECVFEKKSDGSVSNATVEIKISGEPALSYFESTATFIWYYEYLGESGVYEEGALPISVKLDNSGNGTFSQTIELDNYRAIRDINLELEFSGFAVKK